MQQAPDVDQQAFVEHTQPLVAVHLTDGVLGVSVFWFVVDMFLCLHTRSGLVVGLDIYEYKYWLGISHLDILKERERGMKRRKD